MNKDILLNQIAAIIEERYDADDAANEIWHLLGLEIAVKKPVVFGYEPHSGWLPGRKRLVSEWVEDEVVCRECGAQIFKDGHLPWQDAFADDECGDGRGFKHAPKRS